MDDYTRYVTAVNKIYDYIEKMKAGWNNMDNRNYIESINDYKSVVTSKADLIKKPPTVAVEKAEGSTETPESTGVTGKNEPPKQESTIDLNLDDDEDDLPADEDDSPVEDSSNEGRTFAQSAPASSNNSSGIPELPDLPGLIDVSSVIG